MKRRQFTGKAAAIASTGAKPAMHYPRAQPVRESGIAALADYDETPWNGFGMAAGAPPDVVSKIHAALVKTLNTPDIRERVSVIGTVDTCTPEELREIIRRELNSNRQVIESGRVKLP